MKKNARHPFPKLKKTQQSIKTIQRKLDAPQSSAHERVLMVFTRPDVANAKIGKPSGERVVISELHPKPLSIMYASELAEQRVKHEMQEAEDNIFKKGFVVDVIIKLVNDRPSVFAISHVHDVIDLPDDEHGECLPPSLI